MKRYERMAARITGLLRSHPGGLTITAIAQALHLNRNSVAKYLEILVTAGREKKHREGLSWQYAVHILIPARPKY